MTCYSKSLYIVRRDMRVDDNTALNEALRRSEQVQACFIFDPAQIDEHPYQSKPALQFMLQSLDDLQEQFLARGAYLAIVHGEPEKIVKEWVLTNGIEAVFVNRDYTPFSRHRDYRLQQVCIELDIAWHSCADVLLNEPEQTVKSDGSAYKV
ncbi:MAG TPA: deoxyribodipyrimidine photolyase, partial [Methylococcaceae bacterium]|nr:deoxyribodipyrimidine photolyase [Methylococcaceae bacterium]